MAELKSTPIEAQHIRAGARMVPFGGWNMPVQYPTGIVAEHLHCRTQVALFDCSHMGEFRLTGPAVAADLDRILPRLASTQAHGSCRYNFLLAADGTVVDDCVVYRIADQEYYIVVNAGTIDGDADHLRARLSPSTVFVDESAATVKFDIQGPLCWEFLEKFGFPRTRLPKYYHFTTASLFGVDCILSRTGYTGERGVELYFAAAHGPRVWDELLSHAPLLPAGLGARDTLRLEMGYPLYGHELNRQTTPLDAGFAKMVNLDHEFEGRASLLGPPRKTLIGLRFDGRRTAREGAEVRDVAGAVIGKVSSGSFTPSLQCAVAMAYVPPGRLKVGDRASVSVGSASIEATVVELPFYRGGTARQD